MINSKFYRVCAMLLLLGSGMAHANDDFNPDNPPDPQSSYRLEVTATPEGIASTSGTGMYNESDCIYINSSAKDTDYKFVKWLKDDVEYSTQRSFYFTMPAENVVFTAVYELQEFDPSNPEDPNLDYSWRLYLIAEPEEACSFNLDNGSRHAPDTWVDVSAYANQGFVFDGWYENGVKVSDVTAFHYEMPAGNATLTARFYFMPESPADPESTLTPGEGSGIPGDVNGDGAVDSQDIVTTINAFLGSAEYDSVLDVNNDGNIDVQDTTAIINLFLNAK